MLLAAQLFLISMFLVAIVVESRLARMQIFEGSTLATMCALDGTAKDSVGGISDFRTLKEKASRLRVRLERGSGGTALWLAPGLRLDRSPWEVDSRWRE